MFDINIKTSDYGSLVLTHECNLRCKFCIDQYRGRCEYITMESVNKAISFSKYHGIKDMLLVGGEPTLHPDIIVIAEKLKHNGFNLILTTNYTKPEIINKLDGVIDSFNVSYYNQKNLPLQENFKSDITISAIISKKQLHTKKLLDDFIKKYSSYGNLKFSTLTICNEYTRENQKVEYLDHLDGEKIILFDEIEGLLYRGTVIKRYDKIINDNAKQSLKFHVDGQISYCWDRKINGMEAVC